MRQGPAGERLPAAGGAHHGVELRHLRYLVAVADAGTFTQAAERMFVAQPTLSQQIRRLEEMVGAPLLERRRDGVQLTATSAVAWSGDLPRHLQQVLFDTADTADLTTAC